MYLYSYSGSHVSNVRSLHHSVQVIMDGGEDGLPNDVVNEIQEVEECVQEDRAAMDSVLEEDSRSAASTCDNTGSDVVHKRSLWCLSYTRRGKCPSVASLRQSWFVQEVVHLTRLAVPNVS